jgi:hypothetical protein
VVAKNGHKLRESTEKISVDASDDFDPLPPGPPNELEIDAEGYPVVPSREGSWLLALRGGPARTHQRNASMQDLATLLSKQLATGDRCDRIEGEIRIYAFVDGGGIGGGRSRW